MVVVFGHMHHETVGATVEERRHVQVTYRLQGTWVNTGSIDDCVTRHPNRRQQGSTRRFETRAVRPYMMSYILSQLSSCTFCKLHSTTCLFQSTRTSHVARRTSVKTLHYDCCHNIRMFVETAVRNDENTTKGSNLNKKHTAAPSTGWFGPACRT